MKSYLFLGQCTIFTNRNDLLSHISQCSLPDRYVTNPQSIVLEMLNWIEKHSDVENKTEKVDISEDVIAKTDMYHESIQLSYDSIDLLEDEVPFIISKSQKPELPSYATAVQRQAMFRKSSRLYQINKHARLSSDTSMEGAETLV